MTDTPPRQEAFLKPFGLLFGLGFLGILALPLVLLPQLQQLIPPDQTEFSPAGLVILSLIQPTVLLAIATALGLKLAPQLGFRSHLATAAAEGRKALAPLGAELPLAAAAGVAFGVIAVLADWLILPQLGAAGRALAITGNRDWSVTVNGVLYGGITEELLIRWGLMTLLVWLGWRLFRRRREVGSGLVWGAIAVTALIFGLAHLPFLLAQLPLTPWLLFRTLVLNGVGGLIFGWLYWKHSLEAAMIAHASTHLTFSAIALLL